MARCNGSICWYSGTVVGAGGSGCFAIAFDDGHRDAAVPSRNVRREKVAGVRASTGADAGATLAEPAERKPHTSLKAAANPVALATSGLSNLIRQRSDLQAALEHHDAEATALASQMMQTPIRPVMAPDPTALHWKWSQLQGCVFVVHLQTDSDSIGSAIGAAALYGGTAARASEVNLETAWFLEHFGAELPPLFKEIDGFAALPVCLVDHNQVSQMAEGATGGQLRGIIDHHAVQDGAVATARPIWIDIRPWGSTCTVVAHSFIADNRRLTRTVAGCLLSGILSDTLNLCSPTATASDRLAVAVLAKLAAVEDPNELAKCLFRQKALMVDTLGDHEICVSDQKLLEFRYKVTEILRVGFAVVETPDPACILDARRESLLAEMRAIKRDKGFGVFFVAVVDVCKVKLFILEPQ